MPTLDWIGKQAVVNHDQDVPFHLLRDVAGLGCGPADSGNLIVEGDNLTALKALLPYYAGQVKCIYIDPPDNTGNEGWVYNDNVNYPEIKAWLGKVAAAASITTVAQDGKGFANASAAVLQQRFFEAVKDRDWSMKTYGQVLSRL